MINLSSVLAERSGNNTSSVPLTLTGRSIRLIPAQTLTTTQIPLLTAKQPQSTLTHLSQEKKCKNQRQRKPPECTICIMHFIIIWLYNSGQQEDKDYPPTTPTEYKNVLLFCFYYYFDSWTHPSCVTPLLHSTAHWLLINNTLFVQQDGSMMM